MSDEGARIVDFPTSIEADAAQWIARLDRGQLGSDEREELRRWIARSPAHAAEIRALAECWDGIDAVIAGGMARSTPGRSPALLRRILPGAALATAAALAALLLVPRLALPPAETAPVAAVAGRVYATAVGEQSTVTLADGSSVTLNTDTVAQARFDVAVRQVDLLRGEAYFAVAHDPDHPFRVRAGADVVQAIGTAFTVRIRDVGTEVTVTEGRVRAWSPTAKPAPAAVEIGAGESTVIGGAPRAVQRLQPDEIVRKLAWQKGMLAFEGEPLADAIEEISRYTGARIVIADPELRHLRVGGYFKAGDVDLLLHTLAASFHLRIEQPEPGVYYLSQPADAG